MSIATLKEELLRELAVAALGEESSRFLPLGAGTDLIQRTSGPRVALTRGPALIVAHVHDGARLWLASGTFPQTGIVSIVKTNVVQWIGDELGVSRLCVHRFPGHPPTRFATEQMPLFPSPGDIGSFLANVLNGHVHDA